MSAKRTIQGIGFILALTCLSLVGWAIYGSWRAGQEQEAAAQAGAADGGLPGSVTTSTAP